MISQHIWRFFDTGTQTAQWNMAVDEVLLESFNEGDRPMLRVYGWENALSLGRFSAVSKNLNWEKIQTENIPCVRRMSGGGILVHGGDLSYALIIPHDWLREKGIKESYYYLCEFLITLYQKLGLNAQFATHLQLHERRSDICLAGTEAYDIVIDGGKMGGNAQRHTRHALLQHGSIPMRINDSFFRSLFTEDSGLDQAASLEKLGRVMTYEALSSLVQEAFCETFDAKLVSDTLSLSEQQRALELQKNKYTQSRWNDDA